MYAFLYLCQCLFLPLHLLLCFSVVVVFVYKLSTSTHATAGGQKDGPVDKEGRIDNLKKIFCTNLRL